MNSLSMHHILGSIAVLVPVVLILCQPWDSGGPDSSQEASDIGSDSTSAAPTTANEFSGILATTDLGLGSNRVSFLVIGHNALVAVPKVPVTSTYLPPDGSAPIVKEEVTATFHLWPYETRGSYVTQLTLDRPGIWELAVRVQEVDGSVAEALISLVVRDTSATPALGSLPPMTANKTIADVTSLSQLTSWSSPDPELYQMTIAQAVISHGPSLVVFSSPALCTSPTCGPQVEAVSELKESYQDRASFIHVEVYDNPDEIQGDLGVARYSPVVKAWGLTDIENYLNESWVFILDREGRIAIKYQGFASVEELEQGLLQVLQPDSS